MLTPDQIIASHLPVARRQLLETAVLLDAYAASVRQHGKAEDAATSAEMRRFQEALELLAQPSARGRLEDELWAHFARHGNGVADATPPPQR